MVKKIFLTYILIIFMIFTNSCFLLLDQFVSPSDLNERLRERDNTFFVDSLPDLETGTGGYSFLVISDTHIRDGKYDGLEKLYDVISNHGNIKFAVITGDITEGRIEDLKVYLKIAEEIKNNFNIPFYPVIGNHDIFGSGWTHWRNNIGSTNYRIDDKNGNATLLMLDVADIYYGKDQLDWLERELYNINTKDVFVFSHITPFSQGIVQQIDERERVRLTSILRNKCTAMFGGHTHLRFTRTVGNVNYITLDSYRYSRAYCIATVTDSGIVLNWGKL